MKRRVLFSLISIIGVIGLTVINIAAAGKSYHTQKNRKTVQVEALNPVPIYADNSQGSPISIQDASVREISGDEFTKIVGEPSRHYRYSTFPEVNLLNTSGRTIRSFAIAIKNEAEKKGYMFLKGKLSLLPGATYKVNPFQWIKAERSSMLKEGKYVSVMQKPSVESSKYWMIGSPSDLKVVVGMVEFDDGSRWMIPPKANE